MNDAKRILIVEDDALIAMDLEDELADLGYATFSASSEQTAKRMLAAGPPDFAILDIHLRSGTTFELASLLRSQGVPFVFLSGDGGSSLPDHLSSSASFTKPVNIKDIIAVIRATDE